MNVKHISNQISTSLYRKPTFTGLFSKYASFTPILYKKNLVSILTYRAFNICSDYFSLDKEINFIKSILRLNGYPLYFIECTIKKTLNRPGVYNNILSDHSESMIVRKKSLLGSEPSWYCNTCIIYLFICIRITVFWQKSPGNSKLRIDSYFSKLQSNDSHF